MAIARRTVGDILVRLGLVSEATLKTALSVHERTGERLDRVLVRMGACSEADALEALSYEIDAPTVSLRGYRVPAEALAKIPATLARQRNILPVHLADRRLVVATLDPTDLFTIDQIQAQTGCRIDPVLVPEAELREAIQENYAGERATGPRVETVRIEYTSEGEFAEEAEGQTEDAGAVARLLDNVVLQAVERRASDIHLEPTKEALRVRVRIDGLLQESESIPRSHRSGVVSRVKVLSGLNIAEHRVPQDGRLAIRVYGREVGMRVSTLPTTYGEKVVLRLLEKTPAASTLSGLGLESEALASLEEMLDHRQGLILVAGPTGSGKSTTLYASINRIKSPTINIVTVEDPIEYEMEGVNQSQVNPRAGLTFATQLRAILRQDPDVIMVGEIRDKETAEMAFRAALTGHLVLSTLHTNDATSTVIRLLDMEIDAYLISAAVLGVVAQRLVRRLCPKCRQAHVLSQADGVLGLPAGTMTYDPVGCQECANGYRGRLGLFEVLRMDNDLKRLIASRSPESALQEHLTGTGFVSIHDDARRKVSEGVTSLQEVWRVLSSKD